MRRGREETRLRNFPGRRLCKLRSFFVASYVDSVTIVDWQVGLFGQGRGR